MIDELFGPEKIIEKKKICPECNLPKKLEDFKTSLYPGENSEPSTVCYECLCLRRQRADEKRNKTKERKNQVKSHRHEAMCCGQRLKPDNEAWARYCCNNAKKRAVKSGVPFTLTYEDIMKIIPLDGKCPILGIELIPNIGGKEDNSPSLDRVKPILGYIVGNIRIVCERVNRAKNNLSPEELFKIWLDYTEYTTGKKMEVTVKYIEKV